jgi:FMN-dependent NADH-azoreductase
MKLLHLDSSILGDNSASRAISAAVVERLRAAEPSLDVTYRDLAADPVPHLTLDTFMQLGDGPDVGEFLAADIVVIGAGFYNFSIPSQLKAWIDRIVVKGQTFNYGEAGPVGLAGGKRVIVALARGGVYGSGTPRAALEHAETLLRTIFGLIGCELEFVVAEGLAMGDEARRAAVEGALDRAKRIDTRIAAAA